MVLEDLARVMERAKVPEQERLEAWRQAPSELLLSINVELAFREPTGGSGMEAANIQSYARQLFEAQGAKAIAEAAQKAGAFERRGEKEEAETWRRIEAALILLRGPRET